jgi:DNA-binding phage protein
VKTLPQVSLALRQQLEHTQIGRMELCAEAGVTARTLRHVLSGNDDFKLSTLMAVADKLGLELLLVPKAAAPALAAEPAATAVRTRVQASLDKLKG